MLTTANHLKSIFDFSIASDMGYVAVVGRLTATHDSDYTRGHLLCLHGWPRKKCTQYTFSSLVYCLLPNDNLFNNLL